MRSGRRGWWGLSKFQEANSKSLSIPWNKTKWITVQMAKNWKGIKIKFFNIIPSLADRPVHVYDAFKLWNFFRRFNRPHAKSIDGSWSKLEELIPIWEGNWKSKDLESFKLAEEDFGRSHRRTKILYILIHDTMRPRSLIYRNRATYGERSAMIVFSTALPRKGTSEFYKLVRILRSRIWGTELLITIHFFERKWKSILTDRKK